MTSDAFTPDFGCNTNAVAATASQLKLVLEGLKGDGRRDVASDAALASKDIRRALDDFEDNNPIDEIPEQTVTEIFWEELDLVWRTLKFVLYSYTQVPKKFGTIAAVEAERLWDFWLGKPMRPRNWEIYFPRRNEL